MKICSILFGVLAISGTFVSAQNRCQTPNKENGKCVPLQECQTIYNILVNADNSTISPANRTFLAQSQCGWESEGPLVCCSLSVLNEPVLATRGFFHSISNLWQRLFGSSEPEKTKVKKIGLAESDLPQSGECGTSQLLGGRIVGGDVTAIGEYPWLALIEYSKNGRSRGYLCGGSLINRDYVLTAAHCITGAALKKAEIAPTGVRLGEHDLTRDFDCEEYTCADPVVDLQIAQTIVHENYDRDSKLQNDDIALIRLQPAVNFTDYIRPICLPFAQQLRNRKLDATQFTVTGFGRTENASRSDVKLKVEVDGFDFDRCSERYTITGLQLIPTQLCAGGKQGEDSCQGDSGGPLMGEDTSNRERPFFYLAGIVSFGLSTCGLAGYPAIYTRVDQYLPWILGHMSN